MLPPNILRYNPIKQPKSKCGPFDCKVLDRNGLMKYIVTGEEQSREELVGLQKRLKWLIERK
jgi:hypothetical protein